MGKTTKKNRKERSKNKCQIKRTEENLIQKEFFNGGEKEEGLSKGSGAMHFPNKIFLKIT